MEQLPQDKTIFHQQKHFNELISIFSQCVTNSLERVKKNWYFFNKEEKLSRVNKIFEETLENSYSTLWQIVIKFINYEIVDCLGDFITEEGDLFRAKCNKELDSIASIRHEFEIPEVLEKDTFIIKEESEEDDYIEEEEEEDEEKSSKNHVKKVVLILKGN